MRAAWRLLLILLATALAFALVAITVTFLATLLELTPGRVPPWAVVLSVAAMLGLPIVASALLARTLVRRLLPVSERPRWLRPVVYALAAGYVVTAVFGAPACQSFQSQWAVAEYKRIQATGTRGVWPEHPHFATYAAVPLLPFVVLEYHEYALAGLNGFGGFELFVWYGAGVKSVAKAPMWVA